MYSINLFNIFFYKKAHRLRDFTEQPFFMAFDLELKFKYCRPQIIKLLIPNELLHLKKDHQNRCCFLDFKGYHLLWYEHSTFALKRNKSKTKTINVANCFRRI